MENSEQIAQIRVKRAERIDQRVESKEQLANSGKERAE